MATVGLLLSGCGVYDGAEIHESTLALLALVRAGATVVCTAPDIAQSGVVDHVRQSPVEGASRSVLSEAARIARGNIRPTAELGAAELDALFLPGGFGAATNLCDYASKGAQCTVEPSVRSLVETMIDAGKPVAAVCIAPPLLGRVLQLRGVQGARLTIGNDPEHAARIEAMGHVHIDCPANGCVVDEEHRIITSPAYMLAADIAQLATGIDATVEALLELA